MARARAEESAQGRQGRIYPRKHLAAKIASGRCEAGASQGNNAWQEEAAAAGPQLCPASCGAEPQAAACRPGRDLEPDTDLFSLTLASRRNIWHVADNCWGSGRKPLQAWRFFQSSVFISFSPLFSCKARKKQAGLCSLHSHSSPRSTGGSLLPSLCMGILQGASPSHHVRAVLIERMSLSLIPGLWVLLCHSGYQQLFGQSRAVAQPLLGWCGA